ncbi:hypothetical protein [Polyangium sp. y55x31]|uniref:hypothetical protein n=1 Tax=Polyangium sp. y55x31 TaxID=3042688 RepID=UPI0024827103|nr:hypothetical protein [Polyangium sp. y55x31]MDI1476879.1 hypothetical protein [Polyangium sp. y55x31]
MRSNDRIRWAGCFLFVASVVAAPASVYAGDPAADRDEAKRLYVEAKRLRTQGKRAEALERFRRAHELAPTPVLRLELARMLEGEHKLVEAHRLLASIEAMPVSPTETQKGKDARAEARALAAAIGARIPKVTITALPSAPGAQILLDGAPLPSDTLGAEIPLDPGEHRVSLVRGDATVEKTITLAEGERLPVELRAPEPEPEPAPAPSASTPPASALPPFTTTPTAAAPPLAPRPAPAEPPPRRALTPWVPVSFAAGGLALAAGLVTGGLAMSQVDRLERGCPGSECPPPYHDLLAAHQALTTTSSVTIPVGAALLAAGAVTWVVTKNRSASPITATLRWTGAGLAVDGAW